MARYALLVLLAEPGKDYPSQLEYALKEPYALPLAEHCPGV